MSYVWQRDRVMSDLTDYLDRLDNGLLEPHEYSDALDMLSAALREIERTVRLDNPRGIRAEYVPDAIRRILARIADTGSTG